MQCPQSNCSPPDTFAHWIYRTTEPFISKERERTARLCQKGLVIRLLWQNSGMTRERSRQRVERRSRPIQADLLLTRYKYFRGHFDEMSRTDRHKVKSLQSIDSSRRTEDRLQHPRYTSGEPQRHIYGINYPHIPPRPKRKGTLRTP